MEAVGGTGSRRAWMAAMTRGSLGEPKVEAGAGLVGERVIQRARVPLSRAGVVERA